MRTHVETLVHEWTNVGASARTPMHVDKSNHAQGADRVRRMSCCFARRRCKRRLSHAQRSFCDMRTLSMRNGRKRTIQHRRRQSWVLLTPRRSQQHSAPRAKRTQVRTGAAPGGTCAQSRPGRGWPHRPAAAPQRKTWASFVSDKHAPQMSQSLVPKPQGERAVASAVRGSCAPSIGGSRITRDVRLSGRAREYCFRAWLAMCALAGAPGNTAPGVGHVVRQRRRKETFGFLRER